MGLSRAALWGLLGNLTVVEPILLSAYENEEYELWKEENSGPHSAAWHTSFHASSFPGSDKSVCGRAQVYGLMNPASEKPFDPKTRGLFNQGTDIEHRHVERLSRYGVLLSADVTGEDEYQTNFEDSEYWLSGSPDAIILPPFWNKGHVIDVKSTCLVGDTLVAVADGRNAVTLRRLAEENKDVDVYSSNNGRTEIRRMRNIKCTKINTKIIKVNLDDGSFIRCTPEHKLLLLDGTYCEASKLINGTSLMRFDSWAYPDNSGAIRRNIWMGPKNGAGNRWEAQFRLVGKRKFRDIKGKIIHHSDEDTLNDSPDNFELLTHSQHAKAHQSVSRSELISRVSKEAWAALSPEERTARGYKMAAARNQLAVNEKLRKTFNDKGPEWRRKRGLKAQASLSSAQRTARANKIWEARYKKNDEITLPTPKERREIRKIAKLTQEQLGVIIGVSKGTVKRWEDDFEQHPPTEYNREKYKEVLDSLSLNHKVISIENDGYEDTYCGTVEKTGNFAIITSGNDFKNDKLSGVIVSNSHEKVLNMQADPTQTIYSHKKYIRQLKSYIAEAHKKFSPTVVVCGKSGVMIKNGKDKCAVKHKGKCAPRILKVLPPDDGTLFYVSREEPVTVTASYYVAHDPGMMVDGKKKLREWKEYFIQDQIPPHVREGESSKWSVGECKYCPMKKFICKKDYADKTKKLSESALIEFTKKIRPQYDAEATRNAVLSRWGVE